MPKPQSPHSTQPSSSASLAMTAPSRRPTVPAQANAAGTVTHAPQTGFPAPIASATPSRAASAATAIRPQSPCACPRPGLMATASRPTPQPARRSTLPAWGLMACSPSAAGPSPGLGYPVRTCGIYTGAGTHTITSFNTSTGALSYRLTGAKANNRGSFQFCYMGLGGVNTAEVTITAR